MHIAIATAVIGLRMMFLFQTCWAYFNPASTYVHVLLRSVLCLQVISMLSSKNTVNIIINGDITCVIIYYKVLT